MALDVKEIHGYEPAFGLRVFTATAVAAEEWSTSTAARKSLSRRQEGAST